MRRGPMTRQPIETIAEDLERRIDGLESMRKFLSEKSRESMRVVIEKMREIIADETRAGR